MYSELVAVARIVTVPVLFQHVTVFPLIVAGPEIIEYDGATLTGLFELSSTTARTVND